jgi:hypothetical protein
VFFLLETRVLKGGLKIVDYTFQEEHEHRGDIDGWFIMSFAEGIQKSRLVHMHNGQQYFSFSQRLWPYLPLGLIKRRIF